MWVILLVAIVLAWAVLKHRETREPFIVKYGNPFDGEALLSFDRDSKGTRLVSTTPDTCPKDKPVLDAGLCYPKCEEGYNGVGPVCWAETHNRGSGRIPDLSPCSDEGSDWVDTGAFCNEKIWWKSCGSGLAAVTNFLTGQCGPRGGRVRAKRLVCGREGRPAAQFPDNVAGLCYRTCPANKPRAVPGMPYLCFQGSRGLSYGRGVGSVPPLFHFGE